MNERDSNLRKRSRTRSPPAHSNSQRDIPQESTGVGRPNYPTAIALARLCETLIYIPRAPPDTTHAVHRASCDPSAPTDTPLPPSILACPFCPPLEAASAARDGRYGSSCRQSLPTSVASATRDFSLPVHPCPRPYSRSFLHTPRPRPRRPEYTIHRCSALPLLHPTQGFSRRFLSLSVTTARSGHRLPAPSAIGAAVILCCIQPLQQTLALVLCVPYFGVV